MAKLPPVTYSPGTPVDAETIYKESLYAPTSNVTNVSELTFEILNGGMTIANYAGAANKLKAHQIAMGSMAQGYYFGFNRTDFMYGEQFNRYATDVGGTVTDSIVYSAPALETSFRFVSKTGMIEGASAPGKGHLQVRVCVGAQIKENDPRKSKIKTPSGSIWLVALR